MNKGGIDSEIKQNKTKNLINFHNLIKINNPLDFLNQLL